MTRFTALALCLASICACAPADAPESPPNIVLIVGDDHGYPDFGFMGSEIARTPHLDRLAEGGRVFPIGYSTASVCRPSLRSLLTGLHPLEVDQYQQRRARQGVPPSPKTPLRELFHTLPALLAERGYASFQSGKYQEGRFENAGFTHGMTHSAGKAGRREGIAIARETMDPVFEFIDEHLEQPFLVWFAPQLPHLPHDPPQRLRDSYKGLGLPWFAPGYYASVTWFDESVGRLVEHLEKRGLRERTLIVYLADNGWQPPADGVDYDFVLGGAKGKLSLHELGFRTPVIFNQPGRIAPGRSETALVSAVDLFPTLLGIAGANVPPSREGRDLRPAVEAGTPVPRDVLIGTAATLRTDRPGQPAGGAFLRDHRWHYLWYNDGREALFDLEADPDEQRDVAALHRERVEEFRRRITAWVDARTDAAERGASDPTAY